MLNIMVDGLGPKPHVSVGSQALVMGAMQILHRRFPDAVFHLFSALPEVEDEYLKASGLRYTLVKKPQGSWQRIVALRKLVSRMDAIVSPWGDAFITLPPYVSLRKTIFLKRPGVPLMLFTSSLGPFRGAAQTLLAKAALRLFDILTVRDTVTYDYFRQLGIDRVTLVPDSAYVLEPVSSQTVKDLLAAEHIPGANTDYICINVSVLLLNRMSTEGRDYLGTLRRLIDHVRALTGKGVILLPHQVYPQSLVRALNLSPEQLKSGGGDDRQAVDLLYRTLSDTAGVYRLQQIHSAAEYKGIIEGTEMFIGGRMHTVIGATSVNVPSAIMQYSHKALGLMRLLGLEDYVWRTDEPVERLLDVVDSLWAHRAECRSLLAAKMPGIKSQAYGAADLLAEMLHVS
jgi:polysaccharide pyruvyl transferase WcaK-like protein